MGARPIHEIGPDPREDAADRRVHRSWTVEGPLVRCAAVAACAGLLGIAPGTTHGAGPLAFPGDGHRLVGAVNGYPDPLEIGARSFHGVIKVWDASSV